VSTTSATDIEAVLEESGPDYEDFAFERASSGHRSDVYLVELAYKGETYEVVVKFESGDPERFAVEPKLHEFVADRTEVPIPRILVYEDDPDRDIPPYFVTERIRGENLSDQFGDFSREVWERVVEHVGRILGDLHAEIGFEAFGRLTLRGGRIALQEWNGDWQTYFGEMTHRNIDALEQTTFADFTDEAREGIEAALPVIPSDGVPRLVHDDLQPSNLLYAENADEPITAVLDWEDTLAAHPQYHLAQAEFLYVDSTFDDPDLQDALRERLYEGYRAFCSFDPDEAYRRAKPVYQLSTLLWRMTGFESAYDEDEGLGKARAEFRHRQQFERIVDELPEP
jgi:aminoglycoside phosphotransferase (APT) family kinase protein